ncbi:uncharacterized protein LOC123659641 [Melitaea cinxia]|uniref:uncharacterized protein LOC123659641 n=1 Tax=Melitaea cinxia TaxID=113334 RepID=UPI001E26F59E|nr:uncharacterized protein LOC123659641 [Melitaea cinxia]
MTEISYLPLPFNDEGLFQVLITNQKLKNNNGKDEYGVIIRLHHAVGDGAALIEFLCETLADDSDTDSRAFCVPVFYNQKTKRTLADYLEIIIKFCKIPSCLIDGLLREPDRTSLHGPALNGKKIFKWMEYDQDLLHLVKDIKKNTKLHFSDILISSLSLGLRDYFLQEIDPAPNTVAVILPIRFPQNKNDGVRLENNFTVSILDLEVGADIETVKRHMNELRDSADPLSNHFFLKLCGILPKEILHPAFYSNQATMTLSNLPGTRALTICGGLLKSLVFFIPSKGNTGLSITVLCYGGVLSFGAMADSALISNPDELAIILNGMVKGIKQLHKEFVK